MTLTATTTKVPYSGDGSTTSFPVTFIFWDNTDLKVILSVDATGAEATWVEGTHYTLTGGSGSTGTLTVKTTPTDYTPLVGETLTIKSDLTDTQSSSLPLGGKFPSTAVELMVDKAVRLIQQKEERLDRALTLAESSGSGPFTVPEPAADKLLGWNSAGTDLVNQDPIAPSITSLTLSTSLTVDDLQILTGGADDVLMQNVSGADGDIRILASGAGEVKLDSATGSIRSQAAHIFDAGVLRSDGSTRVGIGNFAPTDGLLHIQSASAGAVAASVGADEIVVEGSGDTGITILSGAANIGTLAFGDSADNDAGRVRYDHATDRIEFYTGNFERAAISATEFRINDGQFTAPDFRVGSDISSHMLFVDASANRVGISPASLTPTDGVLHIQTASAGAIAAIADADELVLENSTNAGLTILAGTTGLSSVAFGDSGDADQGLIQYNHTGNYLSLTGNAVEGIRISSTEVEINPGDLANPDFRVNSDTSTSMFVVDAGANRVGISNASLDPSDGILHVISASAGAVSAWVGADDIVVEGSGDQGITILSGATSLGTIAFGDSGSNISGGIVYNHSDNSLDIRVKTNVTGLKVDEWRNCLVGSNAVAATSAIGSLGLAIDTSPTAVAANTIALAAKDSSVGSANATLELWTEQAVEAIGTFTASHKLRIWINGTEYWIQLDAV